MHRHQREQRHQALRAIHQANQRNAYHHRVGKSIGQRQHGGAAMEALHQQGSAKQDDDGQEVSRDRLEVQLLDAHPAHGAKQQGRREQQKNQV